MKNRALSLMRRVWGISDECAGSLRSNSHYGHDSTGRKCPEMLKLFARALKAEHRKAQRPFVEYLNGYLESHSPGSYDGDACVRCESIREFLKRTLTPSKERSGR